MNRFQAVSGYPANPVVAFAPPLLPLLPQAPQFFQDQSLVQGSGAPNVYVNCGGQSGGCQSQFPGCYSGCGGGCTPYSCYSNCGWQSGPCASNGCCGFNNCYPCGNPWWNFGCRDDCCGGCGRGCGKGRGCRDCRRGVKTLGEI